MVKKILAALGAIAALVLTIVTLGMWRRSRARDNELADQAEELGQLKGQAAADKVKDAGAAAEAKVKDAHAKLDEEAKHAIDSGSLADDIAKLGGK